ncbi:MAG TPA: hypothetical protein VHQ64_17695 [Pyrinomonadaceae bacterium]|jgi:hypothetical protein|nr:hypothetical protein [Pyrinomonadaceae bacterium]
MAAAHDVPAQFATNMTAISDREAAFADVNPFTSAERFAFPVGA